MARKRNTLINSISGLLNKITIIVFTFGVRWVFVRNLDVELLGLEGLFTNVFSVFSLLEAGFGTAISFNLFKPIHENNRNELSAIMKFYRRVYKLIGIIVLILSLIVSNWINLIIKDNTIDALKLQRYFLIYALSIVLTYFFASKRTFLFAIQKNYITLNIDTMTKIISGLLQVFVLLRFKSYELYLLTLVFAGLLSNVMISIYADRQAMYDKNSAVKLPQEFKRYLKKNIGRIIINNVSWTGINSTDNLIISSVVGPVGLAKNANYNSITNSLSGFVTSILTGAGASFGDLLAEDDIEKQKNYFERYTFIYQTLASYVALGIFFASKPLMSVWVGDFYIFSDEIVLFISLNVFLRLIFDPIATYQNYSGLFGKYTPYAIIAVFVNLITSIVLSRQFGIAGVFIGTTITFSFIITVVARIIHKNLFNCKKYCIVLAKHLFVILLSGIIIWVISSNFPLGIIGLLCQIVLVTLVFFSCLYIVFRKDDSFLYFCNYSMGLTGKIKSRLMNHKDLR